MTQVDYVNHMIRYKNVLVSFYFKISNMTLVHRYAVPITTADLRSPGEMTLTSREKKTHEKDRNNPWI